VGGRRKGEAGQKTERNSPVNRGEEKFLGRKNPERRNKTVERKVGGGQKEGLRGSAKAPTLIKERNASRG